MGARYPEDTVRDARFNQKHQCTLYSDNARYLRKVFARTTSVPPT